MSICIDVAHAAGHHGCFLSGLCSSRSEIIPRGTILFREGDAANGVFILRAGRVLLTVCHPGRHPRLLRIARAGEILGLATLFTHGSWDATAEVALPLQFSFVPHEMILQRFEENPSLRLDVLRQLSHDVISCHDFVRTAH